MHCKRFLLGVAIFSVCLAYHYYIPIPHEFSRPWLMQMFMGSQLIIKDLSELASKIGLINFEPLLIGTGVLEFTAPFLSIVDNNETPIKIEDQLIDGIPVRVYTPNTASKHGPAVIYFHGGGWLYGTMDLYNNLVYKLSNDTNFKFISVDYRLSVEALFPAAHEDCLKVIKYVLKNAKSFDIDPTRVAVMGDSAGGSLAATVALELRKAEVKPKLQVLLYPVTQMLDFQTPSYQMNGQSRLMLSTDSMLRFIQHYAVGKANSSSSLANHRHVDPDLRKQLRQKYMPLDAIPASYFPEHYKAPAAPTEVDKDVANWMKPLLSEQCSPLFAKDLKGLPETYVYTAFYDVLRDDSMWYVHRLKKEGIAVEHFIHKRGFHAMLNMFKHLPEAREAIENITDFVSKKL